MKFCFCIKGAPFVEEWLMWRDKLLYWVVECGSCLLPTWASHWELLISLQRCGMVWKRDLREDWQCGRDNVFPKGGRPFFLTKCTLT